MDNTKEHNYRFFMCFDKLLIGFVKQCVLYQFFPRNFPGHVRNMFGTFPIMSCKNHGIYWTTSGDFPDISWSFSFSRTFPGCFLGKNVGKLHKPQINIFKHRGNRRYIVRLWALSRGICFPEISRTFLGFFPDISQHTLNTYMVYRQIPEKAPS